MRHQSAAPIARTLPQATSAEFFQHIGLMLILFLASHIFLLSHLNLFGMINTVCSQHLILDKSSYQMVNFSFNRNSITVDHSLTRHHYYKWPSETRMLSCTVFNKEIFSFLYKMVQLNDQTTF